VPLDVQATPGAERNGEDSADIPQTHSADPSALGPVMLELVHLVAQLQGDIVQKAEAAAMWQARAEFLAGQLEQAQLALAAPKEPTPSKIAHTADSEGWPSSRPRPGQHATARALVDAVAARYVMTGVPR
jgi:hypothetical protein